MIVFDKIFLTWQRCPVFRRLTWQFKIFWGQPCAEQQVLSFLQPILQPWLVAAPSWRAPDVLVDIPHDVKYEMKKLRNWRTCHSTLKADDIGLGFGVRPFFIHWFTVLRSMFIHLLIRRWTLAPTFCLAGRRRSRAECAHSCGAASNQNCTSPVKCSSTIPVREGK